MAESEKFDFHLERDDRPHEVRMQEREARKKQDSAKGPMDSDIGEEMEAKSSRVRINLNCDLGIPDLKQNKDSERFTIEDLFNAAKSGNVRQLDDLEEYLTKNQKYLSDSLYQSYGKTALMKALLHLKDGTNLTVERFIQISESRGQDDLVKFVNAASTHIKYKGQTALHIAIERRSLSYVELLVSKGADVHAKAHGKFFRPHDGPHFYFGELPLSLAACTNQPDMVDFLMKHADASMVDSLGNTVLHALVVVASNNSPENNKQTTKFIINMYDCILMTNAKLHPKQNLEIIKNKQGLTPLKLAAKTGKLEIFSHILKREFKESHAKHLSRKFTEWVYGPVHGSLYDISSVDSYEKNSVMEILVYGSDIPKRHEMLQMEPLKQLLEEKWKTFASRMFLLNFLVYLLYLFIFTAVAYNKKYGEPPYALQKTTMGYLYVSGQLVTALANFYFFIIGLVDMKRKRPKLQTLLIDGYYEILFFVQGGLFMITTGLYLYGRPDYLYFLVLCLALSWVNTLYFSRGDQHMGIYSIMIQKMILSDIMRFLLVYIVFLLGFSAAVVTLLIEPPVKNVTTPTGKGRLFGPTAPGEECVKPSFQSISYTTLQLFKFTIGMGDMEFTQDHDSNVVFYVLLIGYIILTYILLLNMLIALMNRTVDKTFQESKSIWNLQRAITILDMEKRLSCCLRDRFRCGLEKNIGEDLRWFFRVEEVDWNEWNINLAKINEDPGSWDSEKPAPHTVPNRGWSWRGWRRQTHQSTDIPLLP